MKIKNVEVMWKDRKRTFLGLPWSFTCYTLTEEKLYIDTGLFTSHQEEIRLFRILDFQLKRTFGQKLFGLGTIRCTSMDRTAPEFEIKNIKKSFDVKELISKLCEADRRSKNVSTRENHFSDGDFSDDEDTTDFENI